MAARLTAFEKLSEVIGSILEQSILNHDVRMADAIQWCHIINYFILKFKNDGHSFTDQERHFLKEKLDTIFELNSFAYIQPVLI
jgi:hypothetical protein